MPAWINIDIQRPVEGQLCWTYFWFSGVEIHKYHDVSEEIEIINGVEYKGIFGCNMFTNERGFYTDDVVWWVPYEEGDEKPEAPFDFERIEHEIRMDEWKDTLSPQYEHLEDVATGHGTGHRKYNRKRVNE